MEVALDHALLPGFQWDLTWNQWKQWLKSRIEVEATLVHAGKYRLRHGEWTLREWFAALPSRIQVAVPKDLAADIERAKAIHTLLGEHTDLVTRVRAEVAKAPIGHAVIEQWLDQLTVSPQLRPHHITWMPDYEPYSSNCAGVAARGFYFERNTYFSGPA